MIAKGALRALNQPGGLRIVLSQVNLNRLVLPGGARSILWAIRLREVTELKTVYLLFLVSLPAGAKAPQNVINCDPADAEHCRATIVQGRPMRELVHAGTSVAVSKPVATAEGDFRVFVQVRQAGPGKIEVKPKGFSALYSDPAQTRFAFYDMAAEISQRIREANREEQTGGGDEFDTQRRHAGTGESGPSRTVKHGHMRKPNPNEATSRQDQAEESRRRSPQAGTTVTPEQLYLIRSTLHRGDFAEGFVYFKKPRRFKVHVGPGDKLHEIDIPVNGVVFRFN